MSIDAALAAVEPGAEIRIEVERVHGGWCGYVWITPHGAPLAPVDRPSRYARTEAFPTREQAIAAIPDALLQAD